MDSTPSVPDQIRHNAALVLSMARNDLDQDIGYDEAGVRWLDGYVQRLHERGDTELNAKLVSNLGSFLGECIVQSHGGIWTEMDGQWGVQFDERNAVYPFNKVSKQLESGGEDSILSLFTTIPILFIHLKR